MQFSSCKIGCYAILLILIILLFFILFNIYIITTNYICSAIHTD
nr:MAG TPA: PBP-dependent ABC transporter [Caudoviricetes sp.]